MIPSRLPTLHELSRGMERSGKTEKWDVVVSYSVEQLNAVLQKLWKSDSASKKAKFSAQREGPGHSKYWTDFDITLAAPVLSFTLSKTACLMMNLSGTYRDRTEKETYPEEEIPSGYYFEAILPIICVSTDGGVIDKSAGMGGTLGFDTSKSNEKIHIVFSFDSTKDTSAVYDIKRKAGQPGSDTFVNTAPYLAKWMKDNWKVIQYSLAEVAPTQVEDSLFLTPEHVAFTVYPTSDGENGCLSLYIKTKDSGNQPGYSTPVFRLSDGESIPIPSGHTASIIIRRELVQRFLTQAMEKATARGEKVLTVNPRTSDSGFLYENTLNSAFSRSFDKQTGLGKYKVDKFNWTFDDTPLSLKFVDNRCHWNMEFEKRFGWYIFIDYRGHGGEPRTRKESDTVFYKVKIDHESTVLSLDEKKITANIELKSEWWRPDARGKSKDIPSSVDFWMSTWRFPSFSSSLRLDFFATTNVFAPGKHIIDIDTKVGLITPYDLLIVGNVVDPSVIELRSGHGSDGGSCLNTGTSGAIGEDTSTSQT